MFFQLSHFQKFGAAPALVHQDRHISYDALAQAVDSGARELARPRSLAAVEMLPEPASVIAYLAAIVAGHAVMPLPADAGDLGDRMVERFGAHIRWSRSGGWQACSPGAAQPLHPDLTLLLQTSGSTGEGRGVRLSMTAVRSNGLAIADYLQLADRDRAALILPLHYSYGLSVLHSHLLVGASVWLLSSSVLDPEFGVELRRSGATSLAGVPHHFKLLAAAGLTESLPTTIDCLTVAGGAMAPADVSRWNDVMHQRGGRFFVMYGQTEATARIAYLPPECAERNPDAIGRAIPGGTMLLRDGNGETVTAPGIERELVYRGPNVMMGYADSAADLSRGPELDELQTGDLATVDKDGLFRITGRRSRFSKIAGLRIGHDALEAALMRADRDVAVWGNDETISVAITGEVHGVAREVARLAGIRPQQIKVIACRVLPRKSNGKIDYPALERLAGGSSDRPGILKAFSATFAPRPVQRSDSFVSLGGDSLQHVELSLMLDRDLGNLPERWEHLSIAQLENAALDDRPAVPMPVLARALAILAVVVAHQTFWPVYGGAAAMVILLGMSIADYRRSDLADWDVAAFLQPVLRVLVPYYLVLGGYALAWGEIPWASVFLVGNFGFTTPETGLMLPYLYWFIEAYVQTSLLLLVVFLPERSRRSLADRPFDVGLAFLGAACLLRLVPEFWPMDAGRSQFTIPWIFHLFAFGWCIATADTIRRKALVLATAAIVMPLVAYLGGNWYGSWTKYTGLLVLVALLLYVRTVRLPRFAVRATLHVAQAAFMIYLLHRLVPEVLLPLFDITLPSPWHDLVAIAGGIALGLVAARAQRQLAGLKLKMPNWTQSKGQALYMDRQNAIDVD